MNLYEAEAMRVHPDKMEDGERPYALTIVAESQSIAKEMCRIHGLTYMGESVAVLETTPDGLLTVYSDDGVSCADHIEIERFRTSVIEIVKRHQSKNMHTSRHAAFVCDDIIDEIQRTGPGGGK